MNYCECQYPIKSRVGIKEYDKPLKMDDFEICQQCGKKIK